MVSTSTVRNRYRLVRDWARDRWLYLRKHLKLVAPCWLAAAATVVMSVAMLHPQTVDALAALAEDRGMLSGRHLAVALTLIIFSGSTWYISRALLYVRYPDAPANIEQSALYGPIIKWLPRLLGLLPIAAVALAFLRSRSFGYVILYLLIGALFVGGLTLRRRWLDAKARRNAGSPDPAGQSLTEVSPRLPTTTRRVVFATLIGAFVALILVIVSPVWVPRLVGPLGVIFLAGAGWAIVGSAMLVYPSRRFQLPSLFVTVLLLAGIFGMWNDNHGIEPLDGSRYAVRDRPSLDSHFRAWLDHRRVLDESAAPDRPYPVFVVTAEGGGIRAAYWTAAVLNAITQKSPAFPCHVFAISGVSGGSLGAAAFAARLADVYFLSDFPARLCRDSTLLYIEDKSRSDEMIYTDAQEIPFDAEGLRVELDALGQDFLSPVLAGMLFPDLLQRVLPVAFLPDRGSYLERSWERSWPQAWRMQKAAGVDVAREFADRNRASPEDNRFRQDFLALWKDELSLLTPSLFLNATRVETGERVIVSNVRLAGPDARDGEDAGPFGFSIDLLDRIGGSVKLSQAVHFSARFTYVSPAATIEDRTNGERARIVDGGYFENSGAVTAGELVNVLREDCRTAERRCQVYVIVISNDVNNPNAWQEEYIGVETTGADGECVCTDRNLGCDRKRPEEAQHRRETPESANFFSETLSPVRALFATRSARGYLAEEQLFSARPCQTLRAQLKDIGPRDIPLGWILSDGLRGLIDVQAADSGAAEAVDRLVADYWSNRPSESGQPPDDTANEE